MALHFVKTSVLSSEDGIDFGKEVQLDTEEARQARLEAEKASRKPLYQQLADQRAKAQEEYDANTKRLFAPPKALDEDDVEFLHEVEETRVKAMEARAAREEAALKEFRKVQNTNVFSTLEDDLKVKSSTSTGTIVGSILSIPQKNKESSLSGTIQPVIKVKKRKSEAAADGGSQGNSTTETKKIPKEQHRDDKAHEEYKKKADATAAAAAASSTTTKEKTGGAVLSLLGGYSSGDSDNE